MKIEPLFRIILCLLTILGLLLSGCSSNSANRTKPSTFSAMSTTSLISSNTDTTSPGPDQALTHVFEKAAKITTIKYDMVITTPDMNQVTTTVWSKNSKMRKDMSAAGLTSIWLYDMDAGIYYLYMPGQNTATKYKISPSQKIPNEIMILINSETQLIPNITGTETIDGKSCWVADQSNTKWWIRRDNGIPIRVEMTESKGKTVMEYKNIDLSDISDNTFVLPEGVTVMELPTK
jgi:outer membrane lipoprotein-sorting protein